MPVKITLILILSATCANAFQCYDSTCLPKSMMCDGMGNCPGVIREDEAACQAQNYKSCLDYRRDGYTQNGKYIIFPHNEGKLMLSQLYTLFIKIEL